MPDLLTPIREYSSLSSAYLERVAQFVFFGRGLCSCSPTERSTEEETAIDRAVSGSCARLSCICVCESCAHDLLDFSDCSEANKEARPLLLHINITLLVARRSTNIKWKYIGRDYSQYRWIGRILYGVFTALHYSAPLFFLVPRQRDLPRKGGLLLVGFCACVRVHC